MTEPAELTDDELFAKYYPEAASSPLSDEEQDEYAKYYPAREQQPER